jgi:sensor histidine kinase regulating citrate/malate metabolism
MGKALAETAAQLSRYRYSVIMEEKAKKERHELKNKYFYIQTLLKENKLEQLENFLTEHIGELSSSDSNVYTNNSLIDYIINTKLALARRNNIKTYTEILIPDHININEEYFCTVLLNLFDNAIEASKKENNPDIQIYLNVKNQYLVFRIKNKVSFDVLEENPKLFTSKEDASSHGLGMKIIRRAVKKAGGILDLSMESGYFVATAMFPILSE